VLSDVLAAVKEENSKKYDEAAKLDQDAKAKLASASLEFAKLQANEQETKLRVSGQMAATELGGEKDIKVAQIREGAEMLRAKQAENKADREAAKQADQRKRNALVYIQNETKDITKEINEATANIATIKDPEGKKIFENKLKALKETKNRVAAQAAALYDVDLNAIIDGADKTATSGTTIQWNEIK
jgi:hypothetical protein